MLRVSSLGAQSLWRDEVDVIRFAGWPLLQMIQAFGLAQHNGPLYYPIMRVWLALAGDSEFGLRYLSACAGVLAVPLCWQLARRWLSSKVGLLAALLVVIAPGLVWYAQDAKMYSMVVLLVLLAVNSLWRGLETGRWYWWVGFVVSARLSLYVHMLSALLFPVYAAAIFLAPPAYRAHWRGWALSMALLFLPYVPPALWQLPLIGKTLETGHPFYHLPKMLALLLQLFSRGATAVGAWLLLAAYIFALLIGIFVPFGSGARVPDQQPDRLPRARIFLVLWLFFPIVVLYLVSFRVPLFEPRYLLLAAPAFFLLVARGILILAGYSRLLSGLVLAVILSFSTLALSFQAATPIKSDFRSAAAYVTARHQPGQPVMFQVPYVQHIFTHYFGDDFVALEGPWTNDNQGEAQVAQAMRDALEGRDEIWFVSSESWLWDSRGLAQAWLDGHAQLADSATFTLVEVRLYRFSDPR
jgi:4-amino-4-deoxy-L-arabinose transferase-like glycosyltransferase